MLAEIGPQDESSFNPKYPEFWEDWTSYETYWYAG